MHRQRRRRRLVEPLQGEGGRLRVEGEQLPPADGAIHHADGQAVPRGGAVHLAQVAQAARVGHPGEALMGDIVGG